MPITGVPVTAVDPVASLVAALTTATTLLLQKSSNLSDVASVAAARTNLGLGSLATLSAIDGGAP